MRSRRYVTRGAQIHVTERRSVMRTNENLEPVAILNICFIAFDGIAPAIGLYTYRTPPVSHGRNRNGFHRQPTIATIIICGNLLQKPSFIVKCNFYKITKRTKLCNQQDRCGALRKNYCLLKNYCLVIKDFFLIKSQFIVFHFRSKLF